MNPRKSTILCVDDVEANLELLECMLVPNGYAVVSAASGTDALVKIKSQTIDLVLLDILMPGMDGIEVCRRIKGDQTLKNIPVIIITSLTAKEERIRGIEAGAEEYLTKPFDHTEVLARIKILLKLKELDDDRTRAEEALHTSSELLREANLRLEEASRAKSDFLANMSHELRTPLNSIIGFADILDQGLQGALTPEQAESVRDISSSGRHLLSLINDILDLSKVEAGKMELEPEEVDIGELARQSLTFFKEKALKHRLALTAEIDEGTGIVVADVRKVKQVIINLLSNAVKFTPAGGNIHVRTRRVMVPNQRQTDTGLPSGEFVEVAVEDSGIGIAPEDQKKLFQPFQQVPTTLTREFAGTGLGLSLCRSFVELHGGNIRVESTLGRGSTFTFRLPVAQPAGKGG